MADDIKKIHEREAKWQKRWADSCAFVPKNDGTKPKYYNLIEFPFPSGSGLHVGHMLPYTGMDVLARFRRMRGFDVLYPIGYDSMGISSENYATKIGKHPSESVAELIKIFERDISIMGLSFNPESKLSTSDPEFIKWILDFTSNGVPINTPGKKNKYDPKNPTFINGIKCSTSEEICSEKKYWPLAAVDGNPKSFFQSANMVKSGGWWMAEFEKPISGRVTIECGILKRKTLQQLYGNMRVEVSSDGVKWQTKGIISKKKGEFSFVENSGKIRFIRVISYSQQEIRLIVRELTIEEL